MPAGFSTKQDQDVFAASVLLCDLFVGVIIAVDCIHIVNGFNQLVARQQLCKHGPTCNNRCGCVFCVVRATPNAANGPINSQPDKRRVFSMRSAPSKRTEQ
jgi:hypothetical protein